MQQKLIKHGLTVIFDRSEVYPDDPGAGTPIMVYLSSDHDFCATYNCAVNEGELDSGRGVKRLTSRQLDWLGSDEIQHWENWVYS